MAIRTDKLIEKFWFAYNNKWGYILGAWHETWTQAKQNAKVQSMVSSYGSNWKNNESAKKANNYYAALYGAKWIGSTVTDCSGLFYWAFKELGGYMYHGSNSMWNKYCTSKGKLVNGARDDGKELLPGTAVFVLKNGSDRSHVGLYVGNNQVIEASGTQAGVIITDITNKKWCEWGELKGVDYGTETNAPIEEPIINVGSALVNAVKVALRDTPSTNGKILTRVDKGQRVQVLEGDWVRVSYQGKTGYMMKKFLDM